MKNNVIIGLVVLVLIIGGILFYTNNKAPEGEVVPQVVTQTQDSILGCYVAHLEKDIYNLNIQSENNGVVSGMLAFNNYEKDSSSGAFTGVYKDGVLLGNYTFYSEGIDSEMQVVFKKVGNDFVRGYGEVLAQGNKVTFTSLEGITYDTNATFIKNEKCLEKFTEVNNKFTFEYNPLFKAFERDQEANLPSTDWRLNTKQKGMLLAHMSIPKPYLPSTNFSDAYLSIGASTEPTAIKSCPVAGEGETADGIKTMSGYPFSKFISSDAGAGNFYETVSYRGLLDGDCYAIEYQIHSTNIGNHPPELGIKEFDKAKIQNEFEKVVSSFKFLVNSD